MKRDKKFVFVGGVLTSVPLRAGEGNVQTNFVSNSYCDLVFNHGFYSHFAQAQDRSGTLQGVVKNSSEAPVSGALVKLKNAERPLMFMVATQAQGRYTANNLPTGKYVLQAIGGDYQSELSAQVEVTAGRPVAVDLSLTVMRAPQLPGAWPGRRRASGAARRRRQQEALRLYLKAWANRSSRRNVALLP